MINKRARIVDIYRTLSNIYGPMRPLWAQTFNWDAERYLDQVALPSALHPMASVLDLGCGPGINLARLRRLKLPFSCYVGIDVCEAMLDRANYDDIHNHKYLLSEGRSLPFKAESFSLVFSTWMFSHLSDPLGVIREAFRVLSPGGWMIVACFSPGRGLFQSLRQQIESFFWLRCIPLTEVQTWPGLVEMKSFAHGWNTIAILRKEG